MAKTNQYRAAQFIKAIPGSGGIITVIADRVGCHRQTAKKYIEGMATVKRAYEAEKEGIADVAESVLIQNIRLALKEQQATKKPVDSFDARWYLQRKAKDRGYTERTELTGAEGEEITVKLTGNVKPDEL